MCRRPAGAALPGVFIAGDCAGLGQSREQAAAQGRAVARQALGLEQAAADNAPDALDRLAYREAWLRALVSATPDTVHVCQCEEVSRADLLGVQPRNTCPARKSWVAAAWKRCWPMARPIRNRSSA
jgi:hypothetical protein